MDKKAISVTQLGTYIKNIFDAEEMLFDIDVFGEISGLSITRDIAYFTLKDENALLSCVLFGASRFSDMKNGDQVVVTGSPKFYVKGGKLNFNVSKVAPFGQGQLFLQFLELKNKLEKEGLFDASHKKQIPKDVKRIGVVSSEGGAVIQDIINVSSRRNPQIDIVLFPVKVQGQNAEKEVVRGIEFFSNYDVDVVIVARGGGSLEDLQPFNTEVVARATYACEKPIVSAVGHETDFTIIDFVSDLRAPTPSAAAELVCEDKMEKMGALKKLSNNIFAHLGRFLIEKGRNIQIQTIGLEKNAINLIANGNMLVMSKVQKLKSLSDVIYNEKVYNLSLLEKSLEKLNPTAILERGYAKLEQDGRAIESVDELDLNIPINTILKDGTVISKPKEIIRRTK